MHFTSYASRGSSDLLRTTKIWEAARATSAASSFFDPIKIGEFGEEFVDGGTGANNPIHELWNEAKYVWPDEPFEKNINRIVSIGMGVPSLQPFGSGLIEIGKTLLRIATETERTAESFHREHSKLDDGNRYFRFNVFQGLEHIGLEDASQKNAIMAATRRYVESQAVMKQMKLCAKGFAEVESGVLDFGSTIRENILNWMSPISFWGKQTDTFRRITPNTGQWFMEAVAFQQWLQDEENKTLWCPGIRKLLISKLKTSTETLISRSWEDCDYVR
jgi:Patatin-like phospholipase